MAQQRRAPQSPEGRHVQRPWWLWPNLLSLDAPLVALSWLVLLKSSYRIYALPESLYFLLAAAVWVIYIADRLLEPDGQSPQSAREQRHIFHKRYQRHFLLLSVVLIALCLPIAFWSLSAKMMLCTAYLGLLVALYYAHRILLPNEAVPILPKELFCGILFALGVAIGPRVYGGRLEYPFGQALSNFFQNPLDNLLMAFRSNEGFSPQSSANLIEGMAFFLGQSLFPDIIPIALLFGFNCVTIACWEHRSNRPNDPSAITSIIPQLPRRLHWLLGGFALAMVIPCAFWSHKDTLPTYLAVLIAALALFAINHWRAHFRRRTLRVLADAALLTPWLVIPFVR